MLAKLNTADYTLAGTNMYYLGPSSLTAMSDLEIDGAFYEWSRIGFRVVRLWGFGHEWDSMTIDSHGGWTLKKE